MKRTIHSSYSVLGLVLFFAGFQSNEAQAVFASPINGGCYIAAPGQCKIHVEPFTINVASGQHLLNYQIMLNGNSGNVVVYSFKTDVSNPPVNNYSPSVVTQDFAATCGATYSIFLVGRDSSDLLHDYALGSTPAITCPASAP